MSEEWPEYEEYWTIPKKVLVRRLTEKMTIPIVKEGVEGELYGEPGHFHIVDTSGDDIKQSILRYDKFIKKYDKLKVQQNLFDNGDADESENIDTNPKSIKPPHPDLIDEEFMPYIVTPSGKTVAEEILPQLETMYSEGNVPRLLMLGSPEVQ